VGCVWGMAGSGVASSLLRSGALENMEGVKGRYSFARIIGLSTLLVLSCPRGYRPGGTVLLGDSCRPPILNWEVDTLFQGSNIPVGPSTDNLAYSALRDLIAFCELPLIVLSGLIQIQDLKHLFSIQPGVVVSATTRFVDRSG
jgi:hypothetical protein